MHTDPTREPGWVPPHCPRASCRYHNQLAQPWPFIRKGYYTRSSDRIRVQRFRCRTCGVNFSTQTFSTSYWLKRPDLPPRIFPLLVGCMCIRQIARTVRAAPETICRHVSRLCRHALLWQWSRMQDCPPSGPLVLDGFRSFEYSQYHPIEHHIVLEKDTSFVLYHTDSELRRSGRMTAFQKRRRQELEQRLGRPDPQSVRQDVTELLQVVLAQVDEAVLHSDEHRTYPRVIGTLGQEIDHRVTHSTKPRTARNPLFEINLFDLLIRHSQGNHKRETIAFSKRRQSSAERLILLQLWRNWMHRRREQGPDQTPAMLKGLAERPLPIEEIYRQRLFAAHVELPPRWRQYYERTVQTREYAHNRIHELKYAF